MQVKNKKGVLEEFNPKKIVNAVSKASTRAMVTLSEAEFNNIVSCVRDIVSALEVATVAQMHNAVEKALDSLGYDDIVKNYREYRNYKKDFVGITDKAYTKKKSLQFIGDKENANTDSALVATKRCLVYNELNKEFYRKFFMSPSELEACKKGYIYIHDQNARLDTFNCCLYDMKSLLENGFEMGNLWYNEPKTLDTAFDVINAIILSTASQQYGGWTAPEVDKLLKPYAEKSYSKYANEYLEIAKEFIGDVKVIPSKVHEYAMRKVKRDFEQGWQGVEMTLNSVGSSRGDYPFITMTFGLDTSDFGKMASKTFLKVHSEGQGKEGKKKPVLFPKLVFIYDKVLHGEGCVNEDVFEAGIDCSCTTMYPDWLSVNGNTTVAEMYSKYGEVISPMGSVDGKEIITYREGNNVFTESFERFWEKYSYKCDVHKQIGKNYTDKDVYVSPKNVQIWDSSSNDWVDVRHITKNYCTDWRMVRLSGGRVLTCTSDHPLQTNRGRVLVKDLTKDDIVLCSSINPTTMNSLEYDVDKAWLYAFILCDGKYNQGVSVSIALTGEDDIQERYISLYKKYTGKDVNVYERKRGTKGNYKDINGIGGGINDLQKMFTEEFGGLNKSSRHIPQKIFNSDRNVRCSFLAGMIDADGYVNKNTKTNNYSIVQIGSVTKELALQQMALANSLGYNAKVYTNRYNKLNSKYRYRVEFICNDEIVEFIVCEKKKSNYIKDTRYARNSVVQGRVKSVEVINKDDLFGYDVTTSSDKFDVSGICSHNCRAFLSPWYERGGMYPADDEDKPVFVGRFNIGAVSLHLPMIYAKAMHEEKDFYEVLDYYLEMIRGIHKRTYEYLGEMKASTNPVAFCEGGIYGGHLKPNEKIKPLLKAMTASFGITALNELQQLHNKKSLVEDNTFAKEVMVYINKKVEQFKKEDGWLYAIYGTPAENLCGLQVEQFRKEYGIIENVSDREYVSNSFHCHVTEDISPIVKQDKEFEFWNLFEGGRIQYARYNLGYNREAVKTLVRRAMEYGAYEGVNLALSFCDDCGYSQVEMEDICPNCGSKNLTKIDRMNGYLAYSRVKGDTRLNKAKMAEISERKSM